MQGGKRQRRHKNGGLCANGGTCIPDFGTRVPNFGTRVPNFGTRVPDFGTRIPNFGIRVPNFGTRVPDFGARVPKFGTCVPDLGTRVSNLQKRNVCKKTHRMDTNERIICGSIRSSIVLSSFISTIDFLNPSILFIALTLNF
jgi:hypothetical protein